MRRAQEIQQLPKLPQMPKWVKAPALYIGAAVFVALSTVAMDWWLLVPYILAFAWLQYRYLYQRIELRRKLLFSKWLSESSSLHRWRKIRAIQKTILAITSLFISLITSLVLFTYKWPHTFAMLAGIGFGIGVARVLLHIWLHHANRVYRPLVRHSWLARGAIIGGVIFLFGWELGTHRADYKHLSTGGAADAVIEETKHPILPLQHFARTVHFSSLNLLRLRDALGHGGWVIYAYLIIPNVIPVASAGAVILGVPIAFQRLGPSVLKKTK